MKERINELLVQSGILYHNYHDQGVIRSDDYYSGLKEIQEELLEEIRKAVKALGVNTPEQLMELNKDVPNTIAEQEYLKGLGYWKCLDDINKLLTND